jgi:hypothetical protein
LASPRAYTLNPGNSFGANSRNNLFKEPSCRIATPRKNEKARSPAFRRNLGWPRFRLKPVLRTFSEEMTGYLGGAGNPFQAQFGARFSF